MISQRSKTKFDRPYLEPNLTDENKVGELFNLAKNFDLDDLRLFTLQNHLPLNVINKSKENLIHVIINTVDSSVSEDKRLKMIQYLVQNGVHPDLPNHQGITPLHYASQHQFSKIIKYLLDLGVEPNFPDYLGKTPLHYLLSGIIKPWINKKIRPLVKGKRDEPELYDDKLELKKAIHVELSANSFGKLNDFMDKLNEKPEVKETLDNIFEKYGDEKMKTLYSLNPETLKTIYQSLIDEVSKVLGNDFTTGLIFNETDLDKTVPGLIEIKIEEMAKSIKENLVEDMNKFEKYTEFCKNIDDKDFLNDLLTKSIKNKIAQNKGKTKIDDFEFMQKEIFENTVYLPIFPWWDAKKNSLIVNSTLEIYHKALTPDEKINYQRYIDSQSIGITDEKILKLIKIYALLRLTFNLPLNPYPVINFKDITENLTSETLKGFLNYHNFYDSFLGYQNTILDIIILNLFDKAFPTFESSFSLLKYPEKIFQLFYTYAEYQKLIELKESYLQIIRILRGEDVKWYEDVTLNHPDTTISTGRWKDLTKADKFFQLIEKLDKDIHYLKSIYFYHFLIEDLSNLEQNQATFICQILDSKFLGTFDLTLTEDIYPRTRLLKDVKISSKQSKAILFDKVFCKIVEYLRELISLGGFSLEKILNITDISKLDKYWAKLGGYQVRAIIYFFSHIQTLIKNGMSFEANERLEFGLGNINRYLNDIEELNIYWYLHQRFNTPGPELILSNFYYYPLPNLIDNNLNWEGKILTYLDGTRIEKNKVLDETFQYNLDISGAEKPTYFEAKLRINKDTLPPSILTSNGFNIFYNMYLFEIIKTLVNKDDLLTQAKKIIDKSGIILTDDKKEQYAKYLILNLTKETMEQLIKHQKKQKAIELIQNENILISSPTTTTFDITTLVQEIVKNNAESIYLDLVEFNLPTKDIETVVNQIYFPIMEESFVSADDYYLSNDYTKTSFESGIREIKFNQEALKNLLEKGANPFIVDKFNESPIHILTLNYCVKPIDILKEIGIDLRFEDKNGFSPLKKLIEDNTLHNSYFQGESWNQYLSSFTDKFYQEIKSSIETKESLGYNYPRYAQLGLNLMLYLTMKQFSGSKECLLLNKINSYNSFTSDRTLGISILIDKLISLGKSPNKILMDKIKKMKKLKLKFSIDNTKDYLFQWEDFLNNFNDSPALFLDAFDSILEGEKKSDIPLNGDELIKYFTNHKYYNENDVFEKTSKLVRLVAKLVLSTQVYLILANLVFSYLQLKYPTLDITMIENIFESVMNHKILNKSYKNSSTLPEIIREHLIPKLTKSVIKSYEDVRDEEESVEYTVNGMIEEIISLLLSNPILDLKEDEMIIKVLRNQVSGFLDIYLIRYIQLLRCIPENYFRWVINKNKIKVLQDTVPPTTP
jgi:ankyrin repeat protein